MPAAEPGSANCCYRWHSGPGRRGACRLGERGIEAADIEPLADTPAGAPSTELQVFARLERGRITDAIALSADCPVEVAVDLEDLGQIDPQLSLSWLRSAWREGVGDEDLLHVVAEHAGGDAVLIDLVENTQLDDSQRKAALFWLAESASDRAVAWFDALLND